MTQNVDTRPATLDWMTSDALTQAGFVARGPEIDYGMRWGRTESIRVSFAPTDPHGNGYLYVHDRQSQLYALLAPATTVADVNAAWRAMLDRPVQPNDYVVMADLIAAPVKVAEARTVWQHCVEQEFQARRVHEAAGWNAPERFEVARAVVVARSARVAAEAVVAAALAGGDRTGYGPAVVNYRILGRNDWTGQAAGVDLPDAADQATAVHQAAERHGFAMQATSFRHGQVVVAASRVPELNQLAQPTYDVSTSLSF